MESDPCASVSTMSEQRHQLQNVSKRQRDPAGREHSLPPWRPPLRFLGVDEGADFKPTFSVESSPQFVAWIVHTEGVGSGRSRARGQDKKATPSSVRLTEKSRE